MHCNEKEVNYGNMLIFIIFRNTTTIVCSPDLSGQTGRQYGFHVWRDPSLKMHLCVRRCSTCSWHALK